MTTDKMPAIYINRKSKFIITGDVSSKKENQLIFKPEKTYGILSSLLNVVFIFNIILFTFMFAVNQDNFSNITKDNLWTFSIPVIWVFYIIYLYNKKNMSFSISNVEALDNKIKFSRIRKGEFYIIFSNTEEINRIISEIFNGKSFSSIIDNLYLDLTMCIITGAFFIYLTVNLALSPTMQLTDNIIYTFFNYINLIIVFFFLGIGLNIFRFNKSYMIIYNYFFQP